MIIDLLFDVIDFPNDYRPNDFYRAVMDYRDVFPEVCDPITRAMDSGTNKDVQNALCDYIRANGYSNIITKFVRSFQWI